MGEAADRQKQASEAQRSISPTDNVNTIGRVRELGYWREDETAEQELEGRAIACWLSVCLFPVWLGLVAFI